MKKRKLMMMFLAAAIALIVMVGPPIKAATMSASLTAPVIDGEDVANYGTVTGTDKWWAEDSAAGSVKGQTFTTPATEVKLKAITYQIADNQKAEPTKQYVIRIGTVSGSTFTEIYSETATQSFTWNSSEYMTWTLDTPVILSANTVYGIDVGLTSSTSGWTTGIPYIQMTADEYAGGVRYTSGTLGIGTTSLSLDSSRDRIVHIDMEHPMTPSPTSGSTIDGGDVVLSWTNLDPTVGSDVWVDVWYGTDPATDFTKVVDAGLNVTTTTVNAPVADTYYWRVDSYLDGSSSGTPVESAVFTFIVIDTDGDGFPDDYELLYTSPPSNTALNTGDDLEPDGLTNWEEYLLGTNPTLADTDGDTLNDGDEITGVGSRPATDPLAADSDGDTLSDGVESNTGTYVSTSDTGTNPMNADTDGDGLKDGVESNTGTFISETDTGTNPLAADTDSDGAEDWYEVAASYTDPTNTGDAPNIPYPLPDPDGSTGSTTSPVKVYIMSGQSNMVGFGRTTGTGPGYLDYMCNTENKFPNLVDGTGAWLPRNDVMYRGVISAIGNGYLQPGFGADGTAIGPELGFGQVMGYYHDEPVLLIKSSIGNRSLSWDYLPPGSPQFEYNGYTYAGYGDSPNSWLTGTTPVPINWYAGTQWDQCFMDESEWAPIAATLGFGPVTNVVDILDNFATEYPQYAAQGFEIAGFVWWQGHKDQSDPHAYRYEGNMVNFIDSIRNYYETRYPSNTVPDAPFVLATVAFDGGWDNTSAFFLAIANGQLAVSGETGNYPAFAGNVKTVEARGYWRDGSISPTTTGYHYNHNSETYMLVGDALGRAMVQLNEGPPPVDTDPPTPNPATFASAPTAISDSEITMTATTGTDQSGPIQYYFTETSGQPGGADSGWQTSPSYTDTGLISSAQYTYTVTMRDALGNSGTASAPASATTLVEGPPSAEATALITALNALEDHITGVAPLDAAGIAAQKAVIDTNATAIGSHSTVIAASFDLVTAYDTTPGFGPLWINEHPPSRSALTDDLVSTMYWVQQYIMDYTYTLANVVEHSTLLDGFIFDCSAVFPGSVAPPTIDTHTATINASYLDTLGWDRQGDDQPARKPTGTYLAPGTIVTVTVPPALVNSGYQIRVGAHSWDHTSRDPNKRLARSTVVYDIAATSTQVANPLGGGIHIEVPYGANDGIVTVDITGAVRSPYFSAKSFHTTTLTEWQNIERNHPAPWADFQTEKYMTQVPTNWIYALDDPVTAMANWDLAIDTMNDVMGFPHDRGKETVYTQVDVIMRSSVHAPGYPSVNVTDSDPTNGSNGNSGSYVIHGPGVDLGGASTEIHEQGHAYFFDKFEGEMESAVNMPHVAILNQCFGFNMDYSLAASRGFHGNPYRTLDNTAIAWMCSFNFSPRNVEMASAEKAYQLKGHAKYADIARLFGWQAINDFFHQLVLEGINKNTTTLSDDDRILRMSIAAGADLRPLFHFWGIHPIDPVALEAAIAAESLPESNDILNTLNHYKSILPANNAEFQAYCLNWWGHQPNPEGAWTESEHGRQWDSTPWYEQNNDTEQRPNGEIYVEATCADIQSDIDAIIAMYFTGSETDPPTPDPATFATAPAADSDTAISMTATAGTDATGPVEYYFAETSGNPGGDDSGWQTSTSYTDTGLTPSTQYTYTVQMRDSLGNSGTASTPANATTLADTTAPTPDPMTFAVAPAPGSGGTIAGQLGILDVTANGGINPATGAAWVVGDTYRLAFFTSATTDAVSSDIATYNAWVQGLADASTTYNIGSIDGATWKVIGSTPTVAARDNTATNTSVNGTGEAIFLLDGSTVVANDYADLWDGSIDNIINLTEQGTIYTWWPWTGTNASGTQNGALGNGGQVGQGRSDVTTEWVYRVNTYDPPTTQHNMYALSDPLVIVAPSDPETTISMTATTATDASGVEYYFTCTAGGGNDSGWQDSPSYTDTGLSPGTQYTYTVTARDKSAAQNATAPSAPASATTSGTGNQPPAFTSDPINEADATEDTAYSSTIADDASDPESDTMTFSKTSGPAWLTVASDGTLSGTPTNSDVGANAFTVQVDATGGSDTATLIIMVINTNDAPTFTADPINKPDATEDVAYSDTISGSATDPDTGDTLTYSKTAGPAWLTVASDGTLSGTPTNSDVGANAFTVEVSDGNGGTDTATLNITVNNSNDAPTFTVDPINKPDATEDAAYSDTIAGSATDPDTGDTLTYSKIAGPAWLTVASDGTLSGTPANSDVGANAFTVQVDDGNGGSDTAAMNITVVNTNDAPTFTVDPINKPDATEGTAYSDTIAGSATDPDTGDTLTYSKTAGPAWLTVATDGAISGTPASGDVGANVFTVEVSDGNGGTDTATLNITVNAATPAPPAAPSGLSATAISTTQINISWTDNSGNETGFKIERSDRNTSNFVQIATVGADVTSFSDTTVRKNTTYYYRIRATNAGGDSAYSNQASATTPKN